MEDKYKFFKLVRKGNSLTFQDWLSDRKNLKRLSCKIDKLIEIETTNEGCSFIYSFDVAGSGIRMIEKIFSLYGFEQFKEKV